MGEREREREREEKRKGEYEESISRVSKKMSKS